MEEEIERLRALGGVRERLLEFLAGLRFIGDVDALPERGKRNPTIAVLPRIAEALGADVEDMVRRRR